MPLPRNGGCDQLYTAALDDGAVVRVRTSHENRVYPGERVTWREQGAHGVVNLTSINILHLNYA